MNKIKNVICSRCGTIFKDAEILEQTECMPHYRYWHCENCGATRHLNTFAGKQPVQRTTWLKDGEGRWAMFCPETGEVIEISKDGQQFPGVAIFEQPKRHGIVGMEG